MKLTTDNFVMIDGEILGAYKGENAFVRVVDSLNIRIDNVEKATYQEAVSTTIKEEVLADTKNSQNGVGIVVSKVEFADNETRVYYSVTNNSGSKYSFYDFNIKINQNRKQFEEQSNYKGDYPSISGEVLNGISGEGIVAFTTMDITSFELHFNAGYSANYDLDFEDFTLLVTIV